jgi:cytochrome c5
MERAGLDDLPAGPGRDQVVAACVTCHSPQMFTAQRKDRAAWEKTVSSMIAWGAPVPAGQEEVIVRYLAEHYGPGGE